MASNDGTGPLTTDELFRQHADFVARFLSRLGVPSAQLEDALQEVFLVAHRNGGYRPGVAKPTSYLANIALRAAAHHRRRDGAARTRHSDVPVDDMPAAADDPARALQVQQDLERLRRALARLPQELCTALVLVELEGESCVSVAAGLGCPVGTIYWRLHQARKELKAALRALDAPRPAGARAQPARSWMILFGLGESSGSDASRLLQLAREQPPATLPIEQLLVQHHALVRAGAELPAWAIGFAPHSASLLALLGAGPIAAGFATAGAAAAVVVFSTHSASAPAAPPRLRAHQDMFAAPLADQLEPAVHQSPSVPPPRTGLIASAQSTPAQPTPAAEAPPEPDAQGRPNEARTAVPTVQPSTAREHEHEHEHEPGREPALAPPPPPAPLTEASERMNRAMTDAELAEMREIARAERLLSEDPRRALALTRALEAGFPEGRFREERAYLEVMALSELDRTTEMRAKGATFLRSYPSGLYSNRVRKAISDRGP